MEVPEGCRKFRKVLVQVAVAGAGYGGFPTALEGSGAKCRLQAQIAKCSVATLSKIEQDKTEGGTGRRKNSAASLWA